VLSQLSRQVIAGVNRTRGRRAGGRVVAGGVFPVGDDFLFSGDWWITIFPGAAPVIIGLSINLPGDRLARRARSEASVARRVAIAGRPVTNRGTT
jgi:hypothetical protein